MSESETPKKIVHPRQRPCPDCGARPGERCLLRTGKPLEEIHHTVRVTGYPVEGTWKPPEPGRRREPGNLRNEADTAGASATNTGVTNKNAGEVAETQHINLPDRSQDQGPDPEEPATQGPVGAASSRAPTEPAVSSPSRNTTPDATQGDQKDVFDAGSNLFQSGKPRRKKPRQEKEEKKPARTQNHAQAEPSLF